VPESEEVKGNCLGPPDVAALSASLSIGEDPSMPINVFAQ